MLKKIIAAAAFATMAASSYAATPGAYAGVDIGSTKINAYGREPSYGAFAGYNFTQNFGVEAGYRSLGSVGGRNVTQAAVSALASLPLSNGYSAYGRLGYNKLDSQSYRVGTDEGVLYGIGVSKDFGNKLSGRIELQRPSDESTNLSIGLGYSF